MNNQTNIDIDSVVPFHSRLLERMILGTEDEMKSSRLVFDRVHEMCHLVSTLDVYYNKMSSVSSNASRYVGEYQCVGTYAYEIARLAKEIADCSAKVNHLEYDIRTELITLGFNGHERYLFMVDMYSNIGGHNVR